MPNKPMLDIAVSQEVCPAQAVEWIATAMYPRQRTLSQPHVSTLARMIKSGHFRTSTDVAFAVLHGQSYCVNGQHTLNAIVKSGVPQRVLIVRQQCTSWADVDLLYTRYDRNRTRSVTSSYWAVDFAQKSGLTPTEVGKFGAATLSAATAFSVATSRTTIGRDNILVQLIRDNEVRLGLMESWVEEAQAFYASIEGCVQDIRAKIVIASVFGVALITFRHQPRRAEDFWSEVSRDNGLASSDPRKALLRWLMTHRPSKGIGLSVIPRYVASCWNAFFRGQDRLRKVYARDAGLALLLGGTPHKGDELLVYMDSNGAPLDDPIPFASLE